MRIISFVILQYSLAYQQKKLGLKVKPHVNSVNKSIPVVDVSKSEMEEIIAGMENINWDALFLLVSDNTKAL